MSDLSGLTPINGVDRERYGVWCAHGKHIMVVDSADTSDYPGCVPAEPWPCGACTLADLIRDQEAEYWAMWFNENDLPR